MSRNRTDARTRRTAWRMALPLTVGALVLGLMIYSAASPGQTPAWVHAEPEVSPRDDFPIKSPIDKFVLAALQEAKIEPSGRCTDEEYIRRVYLDVLGVVPEPGAVRAFLKDRSPRKREILVDQLLRSERYGQHWAVMWGDLLREHTNSSPREGTLRGSFKDWLMESLNQNMPYDLWVARMLTSKGRPDQDPAVNFYLRDANDKVETINMVSNVFMGTRMQCAQCHDHPFDVWEQHHFHELMAFVNPRTTNFVDENATIARLRDNRQVPREFKDLIMPFVVEAENNLAAEARGQKTQGSASGSSGDGMMMMDEKPKPEPKKKGRQVPLSRQMFSAVQKSFDKNDKEMRQKMERLRNAFRNASVRRVTERANGEYKMPAEGDAADSRRKAGELVKPIFPWNEENVATDSKDGPTRRYQLAQFVIANRQFAEVQVNRLWDRLLGRGLVFPVDDFRKKNPPTHPDLLDYLTEEFIKSKFDNKYIIRLIVTSSTYQRSSKPNASNKEDEELYSHYRIKRMTAEQVYDSLLVATGRRPGVSTASSRTSVEVAPKRTMDDVLNMGGTAGRKPKAQPRKQRLPDWAFDVNTPARNGSFLNVFNQPDREQIVAQRENDGSVTQALEMLNGGSVNNAVKADGNSLTSQLIAARLNGDKIAEELYLAALARYPTEEEKKVARIVLKGAPPPAPLVEDFFWALLNTREFLFVK